MIRPLVCIALVTAALLMPTAPARAAESYDNCTGFINSLPATITSQGTWCLNKDLSTAITTGAAITIATNNVILDCNDFKIGGLAAGTGTSTYGVHAPTRLNMTVRNCNIRGFYMGIYSYSGGGHLVEDNRFDSNTRFGMYIFSAESTIRNNLVVDTGGSTAHAGIVYGIAAAFQTDVLNNTITGVAPTSASSGAYGIHSDVTGSITGNRVRGLAPTGGGAPVGIFTVNSGYGIIRDNDLQGPGPGATGGVGVSCSSNTATARDNVIAGFATGIATCLASANIVNTN